jgi:hypothetical protein
MTTIFIVRLLLPCGVGKGSMERIAGLGGELGDQGRDQLKVIGLSETDRGIHARQRSHPEGVMEPRHAA